MLKIFSSLDLTFEKKKKKNQFFRPPILHFASNFPTKNKVECPLGLEPINHLINYHFLVSKIKFGNITSILPGKITVIINLEHCSRCEYS